LASSSAVRKRRERRKEGKKDRRIEGMKDRRIEG
jgi:hypothetical protein